MHVSTVRTELQIVQTLDDYIIRNFYPVIYFVDVICFCKTFHTLEKNNITL